MTLYRRLLPILLITSLAGCASWLPDAHRIDITQGNSIKRVDLDRIHIGMKKSDITPIIGNPMLKDPFHAQRWDYIYRFIPGRGEALQSRLTLYFDGDVLVRIDDSEYQEPEAFKHSNADEPDPVEAIEKPQLD